MTRILTCRPAALAIALLWASVETLALWRARRLPRLDT